MKKITRLFIFRFLLAIGLAFLVTACVHSQVTLFRQGPSDTQVAGAKLTPTPPEIVGVYRSQHPFEPFTELGLITLTTSSFDLPLIYDRIRTDAALQGAQAVVDLKITGETHSEWMTEKKCEQKTECDINGICTTHEVCHDEQVLKEVSSFMTEGSMIRRKP